MNNERKLFHTNISETEVLHVKKRVKLILDHGKTSFECKGKLSTQYKFQAVPNNDQHPETMFCFNLFMNRRI